MSSNKILDIIAKYERRINDQQGSIDMHREKSHDADIVNNITMVRYHNRSIKVIEARQDTYRLAVGDLKSLLE